MIAGQTLKSGGSITISGTTFSLAPSGGIVIAGQTLTSGGVVIVSGSTLSLAPSGGIVFLPSSTSTGMAGIISSIAPLLFDGKACGRYGRLEGWAVGLIGVVVGIIVL